MYLLFVIRHGYVSYVQIGILGFITVGSRKRHFQTLVLNLIAIECVYSLACVLLIYVFDKTIAKAVTLYIFL